MWIRAGGGGGSTDVYNNKIVEYYYKIRNTFFKTLPIIFKS